MGSASNYANPLLQTNALTKSFQKHPPRRPCGKCGRTHGHGDCPAQGATCNICGKKNHWSTVCRSSGRRHSSSGCTPSPGRPQHQRQRRPSGKQFFKEEQRRTQGSSPVTRRRQLPRSPFKPPKYKTSLPHSYWATACLYQHTLPKCSSMVSTEETVKKVKPAGISRPAHPPKDAGETFINTFMCDALSIALAMKSA